LFDDIKYVPDTDVAYSQNEQTLQVGASVNPVAFMLDQQLYIELQTKIVII